MGRRRDESDLDSVEPARQLAAVSSTEDLTTGIDVRRAVSRLPTHDRALLHLRYERDLKYNRIAALMDSPEGTIKVQLYRARQRLRQDLTDELRRRSPTSAQTWCAPSRTRFGHASSAYSKSAEPAHESWPTS